MLLRDRKCNRANHSSPISDIEGVKGADATLQSGDHGTLGSQPIEL